MFWVLVRQHLKDKPARTIASVLLIAAPLAAMFLLGGIHRSGAIVSAANSFAVVWFATHAAANRRTRESGVLRALGASRCFVMSLFLAEAILIALAGAVAAFAFSYSAGAAWNALSPSRLHWSSPWESVLIAVPIVLGAATLGSLVPALLAARKDIVDSLDDD